MAFAAGLKLRGELLLFRADARGRRGPDAKKNKLRSQGPKEDAAAGQLARLPLDQRAQVRAGDLVVAARQGGGARRRRRARASAAVAQLLAVIGPRVAHVCAADRWSMLVKCNVFKFGAAKDCAARSREKLVMPGVAAQGPRCVFSRLRRAAPGADQGLKCGLQNREQPLRRQESDARTLSGKGMTPPAEDRARFGARSLSFCRGCSLS